MNTTFYCPTCYFEQTTMVIQKEETLQVKDREITLTVPVRVCKICNEEIYDKDLDSKTLQMFYSEYRRLEGLLQPEEIKNIRLKYHLSQASLAKMLGFGEKTITRYENGAIQDASHDLLIRQVANEISFQILWETRSEYVSAREREHIDRLLRKYNSFHVKTSYRNFVIYNSQSINNFQYQQGEDYAS